MSTDKECKIINTKWNDLLYSKVDETELQVNKSHLREKLKEYYYKQMLDRLNSVDFGVKGSVAYSLRRLWEKYDCKTKCVRDCNACKTNMIVFNAKVNNETHETAMKENNKDKNKKKLYNKSKFSRNGVYVDLLYDTYKKDWTKAYQCTFHEFFHVIDWLSNSKRNGGYSIFYKDTFYQFIKKNGEKIYGFARDKECQFGEIIIKDIDALKPQDFDEIHKLPKHDKAPLYDAIGGVLYKDKYPDRIENIDLFANAKKGEEEYEQFGHTSGYWLRRGFINGERYRNNAMEDFEILWPYSLRYLESINPNPYNLNLENRDSEYMESLNLDDLDQRNPNVKTIKENRSYIQANFPADKSTGDILTDAEDKAMGYLSNYVIYTSRDMGQSTRVINFINRIQSSFPLLLAQEVFANIAATAIVNQKAFEAMKKYLPNSYNMFYKIINEMLFLKRR